MKRFAILFTLDVEEPVSTEQITRLMGSPVPNGDECGEDALSNIVWSGKGHLEGLGRIQFTSVVYVAETPPAEVAVILRREAEAAAAEAPSSPRIAVMAPLDPACGGCRGLGVVEARLGTVVCPVCKGTRFA